MRLAWLLAGENRALVPFFKIFLPMHALHAKAQNTAVKPRWPAAGCFWWHAWAQAPQTPALGSCALPLDMQSDTHGASTAPDSALGSLLLPLELLAQPPLLPPSKATGQRSLQSQPSTALSAAFCCPLNSGASPCCPLRPQASVLSRQPGRGLGSTRRCPSRPPQALGCLVRASSVAPEQCSRLLTLPSLFYFRNGLSGLPCTSLRAKRCPLATNHACCSPVLAPCLHLRWGLEPKLLSLSLLVWHLESFLYVVGVPLLFCAIVALVLRSNCHVPTLMLGNFVASFFEPGLVVPYMRAGELVTGGEHFRLSTGEFWEALRGHESHMLMFGMLHAIIGWTVILPITVAVLYITFLPIFKYLAARIAIPKLPLHQCGSHGSAIVGLDGASTSNLDCSVHA
ncbi:hypothetical protein L7F22_032412 [Adiantum nelumboides]|nr:hypothetical protein [Adiantum nelumboides]